MTSEPLTEARVAELAREAAKAEPYSKELDYLRTRTAIDALETVKSEMHRMLGLREEVDRLMTALFRIQDAFGFAPHERSIEGTVERAKQLSLSALEARSGTQPKPPCETCEWARDVLKPLADSAGLRWIDHCEGASPVQDSDSRALQSAPLEQPK